MRSLTTTFLLFACFLLSGQTVTWDDGAGTGYWNDNLNWDNDIVPGPGDHVIIPAGFSVKIINANAAVKSLENSGDFNINSSRTLTLTGTASTMIYNTGAGATFANHGTIDINADFFKGIDNELQASFVNNGTIMINALSLSNRGIYTSNSSPFTNHGTITMTNMDYGIYANANMDFSATSIINITAFGRGIEIHRILTNDGSITINAGSYGLRVTDTFTNSATGSLVISGASDCIYVTGTINNSGQINADNCTTDGIKVFGSSVLNNLAGATIDLGLCTLSGIFSSSASAIHNHGVFYIDNDIGSHGIELRGLLHNHATGQIYIEEADDDGIEMFQSNSEIINEGFLDITNVLGGGIKGIVSSGNITNLASGNLVINNTGSSAITSNNPNTLFDNYGEINLGAGAGGIWINSFPDPPQSTNHTCGVINSASSISIYYWSLKNDGLITTTSVSASVTASDFFRNHGVIIDKGGPTTINNLTNNGYRILEPTSTITEGVINNNIFQLGAFAPYSNAKVEWFTDMALTTSAGSYVSLNNTWVANGDAVGLSTLFLKISYSGETCDHAIPIALSGPVLGGTSTYYFLITDGDWNVATNWLPVGIPGANDLIDATSGTLTIPTGYHAAVKEYYTEGNAVIENGASLTIYNAPATAFLSESYTDVYGQLFIPEAGGFELENNGEFQIHPCGELHVVGDIKNGTWTNDGYLFQEGNVTNTGFFSFINNGVIQDLNNSFNGVTITNNESRLHPITNTLVTGQPQINLMDRSATASTTHFSNQFYSDVNQTNALGSYNEDLNIFIPNSDSKGYSYLLTEASLSGQSCPIYMKIRLDDPIEDCVGATITWTGGMGDYMNPNNWDLLRLPNGCDDVVIPNATDHLVLKDNLQYHYRSMNCTGDVTSPLNSKIAINGSGISVHGDFISDGDIELEGSGITVSGALGAMETNGHVKIIGGSSSIAVFTGSFTSNGTLELEGFSQSAIYNQGTFENNGVILPTSTSATSFILNTGNFTQQSSGSMTISTTGFNGINNNSGSGNFMNHGSILFNSNNTTKPITNSNGATFSNMLGGTITMTNTNQTIFNTGTGSIMNNSGLIQITNSSNFYPFRNRDFATINNLSSGVMTIDQSFRGIENKSTGMFNNSGTITITNSNSAGIQNAGTWHNLTGGSISVTDGNHGILNYSIFNSAGSILLEDSSGPGIFTNSGLGVATFQNGGILNIIE